MVESVVLLSQDLKLPFTARSLDLYVLVELPQVGTMHLQATAMIGFLREGGSRGGGT